MQTRRERVLFRLHHLTPPLLDLESTKFTAKPTKTGTQLTLAIAIRPLAIDTSELSSNDALPDRR